MTKNRRVYLLDPKELPPETIAVAFAKTSRSPKSFQEIANELSDESSADFHEKWVVGYGHASVAEHAVLHIAVENISRLAIECLESNRLASYTEKSTRYQKWDPLGFHIPAELKPHALLEKQFRDTCRLIFDTYEASLPAVRKIVEQENPQRKEETESAWERRIRTDYVDVCRYFLPACSLANVGITINGRSLEHAIRKMLSHPLKEVRTTGEEIKQVALCNIPTLVKYANPVPYLQSLHLLTNQEENKAHRQQITQLGVRLVDFNPEGEDQVLAAVLYRFGNRDFAYYLARLQKMPPKEKKELAMQALGNLSKHDIPIRELEYLHFTFDITLDQGAYFELKRHRIMTQTAQPLSTELGYVLPTKIQQSGFEEQYIKVMKQVEKLFADLAEVNPYLGSYIVPNGYKRRVLLTMNLRSAFHLIQLRTAPNAHFSIRLIAWQILEQIREKSPLLASFIPLESEETWQDIASDYFIAT